MVWFKEKNAGDARSSARLFDAETGHFNPTLKGSSQFRQIVVEISSIAESKRRQFRLNLAKLVSCADQLSIEYGP